MATTYMPPALIGDFDGSVTKKVQLYQSWNSEMGTLIGDKASSTPAFYDARNPPSQNPPTQAAPLWKGMPRMIVRLCNDDLLTAAKLAEQPVTWGAQDPGHPAPFNYGTLTDSGTGQDLGLQYRPQDEYLEWVVYRDAEGVVTSVEFTCEGPEYWSLLAETDPDLACALYRNIIKGQTGQDVVVSSADLLFARAALLQSDAGNESFDAGSYNPWNALNLKYAIHLTHPSNSLGAEVTLARQASLLWGADGLKTDPAELAACSLYGEINRASDPTIGAAVNSLVRLNRRVTLRNPIGLYIHDLDTTSFSLDGNPVQNIDTWFVPLRPTSANVTDMILRARFTVPDGVMHNGRQLRVGDLAIDHALIEAGGQIAAYINMTLYAQWLPGGRAQTPHKCSGRPCPGPTPDYLIVAPYDSACGTPATPEHVAAMRAAAPQLVAEKGTRIRSRVNLPKA